MITKFYRIKDTKTGLYSKGGTYPTWSKNGKVWKRRADLSSHFAIVRDARRNPYASPDIVIEEITITESVTNTYPVADQIDELNQRRDKREAALERAREQYKLEQRRKEYERLRKEFENDDVDQ